VAFWGESHRSGELAAVGAAAILPVVVVVRLLCSSSHKLAGDQIPLALGFVLRLSGVSGAGCCGSIHRHLAFAGTSVLFYFQPKKWKMIFVTYRSMRGDYFVVCFSKETDLFSTYLRVESLEGLVRPVAGPMQATLEGMQRWAKGDGQPRTDRRTDWANWELQFHSDAIAAAVVAVAVAAAVVVVSTRPAKMSTVDRMNRERDWLRNRHRPRLIGSNQGAIEPKNKNGHKFK
jgi:hypothetical protein